MAIFQLFSLYSFLNKFKDLTIQQTFVGSDKMETQISNDKSCFFEVIKKSVHFLGVRDSFQTNRRSRRFLKYNMASLQQ